MIVPANTGGTPVIPAGQLTVELRTDQGLLSFYPPPGREPLRLSFHTNSTVAALSQVYRPAMQFHGPVLTLPHGARWRQHTVSDLHAEPGHVPIFLRACGTNPQALTLRMVLPTEYDHTQGLPTSYSGTTSSVRPSHATDCPVLIQRAILYQAGLRQKFLQYIGKPNYYGRDTLYVWVSDQVLQHLPVHVVCMGLGAGTKTSAHARPVRA
eukprot:45781-Rhodomonas_salina.1